MGGVADSITETKATSTTNPQTNHVIYVLLSTDVFNKIYDIHDYSYGEKGHYMVAGRILPLALPLIR